MDLKYNRVINSYCILLKKRMKKEEENDKLKNIKVKRNKTNAQKLKTKELEIHEKYKEK